MSRDVMIWDVVVVGAGAAGLMAAEQAAVRSRSTLLLERNTQPGVKILMSGGTRCNLTHATDSHGIVEAFGSAGRFLFAPLAALSPADLIQLFRAEGVETKMEETGKVFPVSDDAHDVLAALRRRLGRSGAELALGEPVLRIERLANSALTTDSPGGSSARFRIVSARRELLARSVLITTGGKSYPGCGTSGDGYAWLETLGHTIVPPRPALTPVTTHAEWVRNLRGVTLNDVQVRVFSEEDPLDHGGTKPQRKSRKVPLAERRGSFLFTHFGLSGPVVLDISRVISGHPRPQLLRLECDFMPTVPAESLEQQLSTGAERDGRRNIVSLLPPEIPRRLAEAILELAQVPTEQRGAELSKVQRRNIVKQLKQTIIPVSGTMGFRKAEVTAGGVALTEVDSKSMQSKLVPGLYLAGEILDLDGPIGGYNFQAAFSTGMLAGRSM